MLFITVCYDRVQMFELARTPTTEQYLQIDSRKRITKTKGGGEYQLCWERCYVEMKHIFYD